MRSYSILIILLLIVLGSIIYQSGLNGVFLFDDFVNLENLEKVKQQNTLSSQIEFALAGGASNLGRPLSLFSFALQADSWSSPFAFKLFNLLLHLANSILVFIFAWQLGTLLKLSHSQLKLFTFLSTALWLLHPLQISTVLYVIQRMTQLSAFFTLLGIILYVHGRQHCDREKPRSLIWMSVGVIVGLGLGVLSKENAILFPIYLLVIEFSFFQAKQRSTTWYWWAFIFIYFPLLAFSVWLIFSFDTILQGYVLRDFSMLERLLTQSRVVFSYLEQILLPRNSELNLFHDDISISKNLLSPPQTLFSLVFWISSIAIVFYLRKTLPILAFGFFWFIGGHLLESTLIPLMLSFEHRNYLPLLGILFILVWVIIQLPFWLTNTTSAIRNSLYILVSLYIFSYPLISYFESQLWGNPIQQAIQWAERKPRSLLAQAHAAQVMLDHQNPQAAAFYYQQMAKHRPEQIMPAVYQLQLNCHYPELIKVNMQEIQQRFQFAHSQAGTDHILNQLIQTVLQNNCHSIELQNIEKLFALLAANKNLTLADQALAQLLYAQLLAHRGNYTTALQLSQQALETGALSKHPHARTDLQAHVLRIHCWLALQKYPQAKAELAVFQTKIDPQHSLEYMPIIQSIQTELNKHLH